MLDRLDRLLRAIVDTFEHADGAVAERSRWRGLAGAGFVVLCDQSLQKFAAVVGVAAL